MAEWARRSAEPTPLRGLVQRFPIPTAPSGPPIRPQTPPPRIDDLIKSPGAVYLLDAGVGFAFAHAKLFPALVAHYTGQLYFSSVVENEWRRRARKVVAACGASNGGDQAERDRRLQSAGNYLISRGVLLLPGCRLELPDEAATEVADLQQDLADLHPRQLADGANGGECATVWEGRRLRREGQEIVVLCADDDRARRLGGQNGLAARTTPHILREMVSAGSMSADDAHTNFLTAQQVCSPRVGLVQQFACPDDFR